MKRQFFQHQNNTGKFAHRLRATVSSVLLCALTSVATAVDLNGPVQLVHIAADGKLWFRMDTTPAATYCKPSGFGALTMFVPKEHPEFRYYYAMLMTAAATGKNVYVANISIYNGSAACDITKTGYGLMLVQ